MNIGFNNRQFQNAGVLLSVLLNASSIKSTDTYAPINANETPFTLKANACPLTHEFDI